MDDWPFDELCNLAVITTRHVLDGTHPILLVTHDDDDGDWQFLCGTTNETDDARIVSIAYICEVDSSVGLLADLPYGWQAWRSRSQDEWIREPHTMKK